jgi:glycosyltransferase involved in cell wall biosynthesis
MAEVIARDCNLPLESIHTIPNALETDGNPIPARKARSDGPVVLFVGRLERAKGVDALVEAIPKVLRTGCEARFVIIGKPRNKPGGGTYLDYINDRLGELVRQRRVVVKGFVSEDELAQAYLQADIAVVPSLVYESFSYTCAQAMMFGLPVIGSRIGGIPETLDYGKCGILVSPGNADELAEGILTLLRNRDLRLSMGEAARAHAVDRFSSEGVARQVLTVYQEALAR